MPFRLAVLLSGSGTTLENLFAHIDRGELPAEVAVVVSSKPDTFGLERARRRGVPTAVIVRRKYDSTVAFADAVFQEVDAFQPDLVVLAGFMVLLKIPRRYAGRVVNVHPALVPAFCGKGWYGNRVHGAVLARGCKLTGCTVHFCDDQYDHGPIIVQKSVEVKGDDTVESLAHRVRAAEREIYPQAIKLIIEGRVKIDGRRTIVLPDS